MWNKSRASQGHLKFHATEVKIQLDYFKTVMPFPIRTCVVCEEEFELRPDKPGFANRCPACSEPEAAEEAKQHAGPGDDQANSELNEVRRKTIRDMLYTKDS